MSKSRTSLALFLLAPALVACTPSGEPASTREPAAAPAAPNPTPTSPPAPAPAPTPVDTVPAAFLGEWNVEAADCGSSRNDSRLVIERDRIAWWESSGPVTAVTVHGPRDIAVTAELSGEGETWTSTTRFVLREDDSLATTDASGGTLVRHRCLAAED